MTAFGVYVPQLAFSYDDVLGRARLAEELGFESLWVFDHLYGPELPNVPSLEGWTLATALLANTERLRVGHLVLCNNFRHPALLAKMATSLDQISGGRLELGIGSGSYELEHAQSGLPWGTFAERSEQLEESLEILTRMFAEETTTFDGKHYSVRDMPSLPRPVQQPRPPIHIGGAGEQRTLPLVAKYADVWNVPTYALDDWQRKLDVLHAECERIGRDPAEIRLSLEIVLALAPDDESLADARSLAEHRFGGPGWGLEAGGYVGTPQMIVDRIGEHVEAGVDLFVFFMHDRAKEHTMRLFAEQVMPAFAGNGS